MTQFKFTVGDWSHDGHGMTDVFIFETPATIQEVRVAIGNLREGFPEWESVAEDYEDSSVTPLIAEKLNEYGVGTEGRDLEYFFDGSDDYADIWALLIAHFTPSVALTRVKDNKMPTIHGGGYGLFCN